MRYVILGAGAVGGVIGARLLQASCEVVLIARGAHLAALRQLGLHFQAPGEDVVLPARAVGHPDEVDCRPDDVVLLCVKSQDSVGALDALRASAGSDVSVICAQNGVANERSALRRFARVQAMVVMLPAAHLRPGAVTSHSKATTGILDLGSYPGGTDAVSAAVAKDLERANFSARPDPRVMRFKYAKLLMNLGNALDACCDAGRHASEIHSRARAEALACFQAAGIDFASAEEFRERRGDLIQIAPVAGSLRGGGSSWQSLERRTGSIEADYLNGEIALLGRLHGVPTPVNRALQDLANELARAHARPGSFPVDDLLARIERAAASDR